MPRQYLCEVCTKEIDVSWMRNPGKTRYCPLCKRQKYKEAQMRAYVKRNGVRICKLCHKNPPEKQRSICLLCIREIIFRVKNRTCCYCERPCKLAYCSANCTWKTSRLLKDYKN